MKEIMINRKLCLRSIINTINYSRKALGGINILPVTNEILSIRDEHDLKCSLKTVLSTNLFYIDVAATPQPQIFDISETKFYSLENQHRNSILVTDKSKTCRIPTGTNRLLTDNTYLQT